MPNLSPESTLLPPGIVVIVTGGGKGIGFGISQRFLQMGANVVICGRSQPQQMPEHAGRKAVFVETDVCNSEHIQTCIDTTVDMFKRVDVLVNNAGGTPIAPAATASPRFSEAIIRLNLIAPLNFSQAANTVMQTQTGTGTIINIASISAMRASPGTAAYGAAKAGLVNLTQSLAVEWAPKVRVNSIAAGPVETEQAYLHYGDQQGIAAIANTIALQRLATAHDIADCCLYLASPLSSYISGTTITVHGGGEKPAYLAASNARQTQ